MDETSKAAELPFTMTPEPLDKNRVRLVARIEGRDVTREIHRLGSGESRRELAKRFADDERLRNGRKVSPKEVERHIEAVENYYLSAASAGASDDDGSGTIEAASCVNDAQIVELGWNVESSEPDFLVFNRETHELNRAPYVDGAAWRVAVPSIWRGIVTPDSNHDGSVFVPTEADETGQDEDKLRADVRAFIHRYVELPGDTIDIAVEYVFFTWVFDDFDELPYLGFRTADAGRGKSRALETVGALCYRPIMLGGGSSAAAMLRIIATFRGSLLADEFDATHDTELTSDATKILNQGFQRNRPLIKCVGDHHEPRPFRCFGPKLFALRKGLGDDATETRTLSITMKQRTRKDVPINLPRRKFDREALGLRNRLLYWRFANLGRIHIDPAHADPRLEDRSNQIGLPLMAVAGTKEGRARIVAALLQQQSNVATDRAESFVGQVVHLVLQGPDSEAIRPNEIAKALNAERAASLGIEPAKLHKPVTKETIARVLRKDLELRKGGRNNRGVFYELTAARRAELLQRFGDTLPEPAQPTDLHLQADDDAKNTDCAVENADNAGCVSSAGCAECPVQDDTSGELDGMADAEAAFVARFNPTPQSLEFWRVDYRAKTQWGRCGERPLKHTGRGSAGNGSKTE